MAHEMFDLAAQLKHFQGQISMCTAQIANLGEKTFRWESGPEVHEQNSTTTLNSAASQLLQIFEGWRASKNTLIDLAAHEYDRLESTTPCCIRIGSQPQPSAGTAARPAHGWIRIAGDSRFVDIARQRARSLAERIRHQG